MYYVPLTKMGSLLGLKCMILCARKVGERAGEGYPGLNPAAPTYRSSLPMGIAMPARHILQNECGFSRLKYTIESSPHMLGISLVLKQAVAALDWP